MNDIKDFISNILSGNNVEAKENFAELISSRAMEALAERKQEIAQSLFQTEERVDEDVESIEEGPVGAALGGIAGTMLGGPVGGAIGAALGHKTGNVTSAVAKRTGQAVGSAARATGRAVKKVGAVGAGALAGGALGGPVGAALGGYAGHRLTRKEEVELDEAYDGKIIASKMRSNSSMSPFAGKIEKMKTVTPSALDKILPDYISGADIAKLFKKEEVELHEISARLLARAAHSASDPDNEYLDVKDHDPQKFADYAKKTKSAKDAKRVQAAADGEGHWPGAKKIRSYMNKKP